MESEDPLRGNASSAPSWSNCPIDVLLLIFPWLRTRDLLSCIRVNSCWRHAVDYYLEHTGTWPKLAQVGIRGGGSCFKKRSTLSWRDLFFNSRLWAHMSSAKITWNYVLGVSNIKFVHVYRDYLLVQAGSNFKLKCYRLDKDADVYRDLTEKIHLKIEEDKLAHSCGETSERKPHENHDTDYDRMVKHIVKQRPFRRLFVKNDDCFYILSEKNTLICFKWDENENDWKKISLARYHGVAKTIADIHVFKEDVYMSLKTGAVFRLERKGRLLEHYFHLDIKHYRFFLVDVAIPKDCDLKIPLSGVVKYVSFQKVSVIVGVPADGEFNITRERGGVVIELPGLSCATQHGSIMLLGFRDGKTEITLTRNLIKGRKAEVCEYVQHYHNYLGRNPEIVSINVYEVKGSQRVFVATKSHIYELIIRYPEYIRHALCIR